jgi:hypothetical protein
MMVSVHLHVTGLWLAHFTDEETETAVTPPALGLVAEGEGIGGDLCGLVPDFHSAP